MKSGLRDIEDLAHFRRGEGNGAIPLDRVRFFERAGFGPSRHKTILIIYVIAQLPELDKKYFY